VAFLLSKKSSQNVRIDSLDIRPGGREVLGRTFERRATYQAAMTRRWTVRVLVAVLICLVVLAVLCELCLLQAADLRRRVRAVLPPEDEEDR
jgi:hypothetical protein